MRLHSNQETLPYNIFILHRDNTLPARGWGQRTVTFRHSETLQEDSTIFHLQMQKIIDKLTKINHAILHEKKHSYLHERTTWILWSTRHTDVFELCRSPNYGSNISKWVHLHDMHQHNEFTCFWKLHLSNDLEEQLILLSLLFTVWAVWSSFLVFVARYTVESNGLQRIKSEEWWEKTPKYILRGSTIFSSLSHILRNYRVRNSTENDRVSLLPATLEMGCNFENTCWIEEFRFQIQPQEVMLEYGNAAIKSITRVKASPSGVPTLFAVITVVTRPSL